MNSWAALPGRVAREQQIWRLLVNDSISGLVDQALSWAHSCELVSPYRDPCWVVALHQSACRRSSRSSRSSQCQDQNPSLGHLMEERSRSFPLSSHVRRSNRKDRNSTYSNNWNHKVSPSQREMAGRYNNGS
jgi:hypothetical protein